ncbi:HNH endonuclease [Candidatus Entotheonella palauensis]|uniref:HNH endonuclease n=1 Tax=Candidatus Entotheonella palauensis TaxID=93172 RepID=UPI0021179FA5|nr:HNH endonuclease signature motif containing protein [Candidatus Entotheonella palauensis]
MRREVRKRANRCCEYCWLADDDGYFPHEADHIISLKHRGTSVLENLAWSCFDCNRFKGSNVASRDAISGELVPLFHPRQDRWHEHFRLNRGGDYAPDSSRPRYG